MASTILGNIAKRDEFEEAKAVVNLLSKELLRLGLYFQWYVFQRLAVYYSPKSEKIAATDGYNIYLGKRFLGRSPDDLLFILRHELYHVILHHPEALAKKLSKVSTTYERNVVKIVHNIISDAVVNGLILKEDQNLKLHTPIEKYIKPDEVSRILEADVVSLGFVNALEKMLLLINKGDVAITVVDSSGKPVDISKEPIEKLLKKHGGELIAVMENKKNGAQYPIRLTLDNESSRGGCCGSEGESSEDDSGEGGESGESDMRKIKDPVTGAKPRSREDIEKVVREAVDFDRFKRMVSGQPLAGLGLVPGVDYALEEVGSKKPEWEATLTHTLTSFISSYAEVSWHFIDRAAPGIKPGIRYVSVPDVHILLDVSGSMLGGSLEKALKRVIYIVENYPDVKVYLYQWSDGASPPQEIDKKFAESVRKYKKLRIDSGGTRIEPALDMVLPRVTNNDVVVVLTDGAIFDIDEKRVIEKFDKLARKAGQVIFASLGYIPETLPKSVVKIRLED